MRSQRRVSRQPDEERAQPRAGRDWVSRRGRRVAEVDGQRAEPAHDSREIWICDRIERSHRLSCPPDFLYIGPPQLIHSTAPRPTMFHISPASSTSSSSSSIHPSSLVDPAAHSPALLELIDVKVSRQVIGKSPSQSRSLPNSDKYHRLRRRPRRGDRGLCHGTPHSIVFARPHIISPPRALKVHHVRRTTFSPVQRSQ